MGQVVDYFALIILSTVYAEAIIGFLEMKPKYDRNNTEYARAADCDSA